MNNRSTYLLLAALISVVFTTELTAQTSAFTYQGRLSDNGKPATGLYDLVFSIHDASAGGNQIGASLTNQASVLSEGLFTVSLNFGAGVFTGADRWVQIAVRTNGSSGAFTVLDPRQALTPVPTAMYALTPAGPQGPEGPEGPVGPQGDQGPAGATGPQGPEGPAGPQGPEGPQGPIGLTGAAGPQGPQGPIGLTGAAGPEGPAGATGPEGPMGPQGPQGLQGVSGLQGPKGLNWLGAWSGTASYAADDAVFYNGSAWIALRTNANVSPSEGPDWTMLAQQGSEGPTGPQGDQGPAGATGAQGPAGATGPQGPEGPQGPIGLTGATGPQGPEGPIGLTGATGAQGPQGDPGPEGPAGASPFTLAGTNAIYVAGHVGIGTNDPATALHVVGTVTADGFEGSVDASQITGALPATQLSGTIQSGQLAGTYSGALNFNNAANSFNGTFNGTHSGNGAGLTALNASQLTSGTVANARLSGSVSLFGSAVESSEIANGTIAAEDVNAASFDTTFWKVSGNAGTTPGTHFLGTADNQPLELKVNGLRVLRLEDNGDSYDSGTLPDGAPNLIGGSPLNSVATGVVGATIAGGGATNYYGLAGANTISGDYGTIGGGVGNQVEVGSFSATVAGGRNNNVGWSSAYSAIGGGQYNNVAESSWWATIAGGTYNDIGTNSDSSAISGGYNNNIATSSPYASIAGGSFNDLGASSSYATIGGGYDNNVGTNSMYATIAGGRNNQVGTNSVASSISGGYNNNIAISAQYVTIAGGFYNGVGASSSYVTIGGGNDNNVAGGSLYATVAGGYTNNIGMDAEAGTIAGGRGNQVLDTAWEGSVGGGYLNIAGNQYATVPGGYRNEANGFYSFAAGRQAKANAHGSFVWGDSTAADVVSTTANSVTMRASGGYRLFSSTDTVAPAAGVYLAPGASSWSTISDRTAKKDFAPVDGVAMLEKLAQVPVQQWHYDWEERSESPHIGPMAQDFKAAFYPGRDDKSISTLEIDGVALAAIQGLNQKLEQELKQKDTRIRNLENELGRLRDLMTDLSRKLDGGAR